MQRHLLGTVRPPPMTLENSAAAPPTVTEVARCCYCSGPGRDPVYRVPRQGRSELPFKSLMLS